MNTLVSSLREAAKDVRRGISGPEIVAVLLEAANALEKERTEEKA